MIYLKLDPINKDGGGQGVRSMEGGWEEEYFKEGGLKYPYGDGKNTFALY